MHLEADTLGYVWDYAMRIPLIAESFENDPASEDVLQNRVLVGKASLHCPWEAVPYPSHGVLSPHGIEEELIDMPKKFWRQNRLYYDLIPVRINLLERNTHWYQLPFTDFDIYIYVILSAMIAFKSLSVRILFLLFFPYLQFYVPVTGIFHSGKYQIIIEGG